MKTGIKEEIIDIDIQFNQILELERKNLESKRRLASN
jgi:hypothetical protein